MWDEIENRDESESTTQIKFQTSRFGAYRSPGRGREKRGILHTPPRFPASQIFRNPRKKKQHLYKHNTRYTHILREKGDDKIPNLLSSLSLIAARKEQPLQQNQPIELRNKLKIAPRASDTQAKHTIPQNGTHGASSINIVAPA